MCNNVASACAAIALAVMAALASNPCAYAQSASLEKHCDDIKMVFDVASFNGEYKKRAYVWLGSKCRGAVPLPSLSDPYNVQRFNTSARILLQGGNINIAPD